MVARGVIVIICALVVICEGAKPRVYKPNCKYSSNICPMIYLPVCGTNGKTYNNECELCAAAKTSKTKILIRKQGHC
ncbi:serine protease inhibitor Kazal-type 1-like [Garra rufa]|uniref:serine protease inhibitor Kazal-type 1-like n=1 Tax=Garra rufa TaxID=137080 RepID=UPI003CCED8B8